MWENRNAQGEQECPSTQCSSETPGEKGASAAQGRGTPEERSHVPSITQPWQEPACNVRRQTEQEAE